MNTPTRIILTMLIKPFLFINLFFQHFNIYLQEIFITPYIYRRFNDLDTRRLSNGKRMLLEDLVIYIGCEKYSISRTLVCHKYSTTDYSSIPQFSAWIVKWSKVDISGVVHDMLYSRTCPYTDLSRYQKDIIWLLISITSSCRGGNSHAANLFQASICFIGLRLFGWIFYQNRHQKLLDFISGQE